MAIRAPDGANNVGCGEGNMDDDDDYDDKHVGASW